MKKNETKIFDTAFQGIVAVITVRKKGNTYHFTGKLANKTIIIIYIVFIICSL